MPDGILRARLRRQLRVIVGGVARVKATTIDMAELVSGTIQSYVIPRYQRRYEWNVSQWHGVARDTYELSLANSPLKHFFGSFLTRFQEGDGHVHYDLIDGQQRILTSGLWLIALNDHDKQFGRGVIPRQRWTIKVEVSAADKAVWEHLTNGKWHLLLAEGEPTPLFEGYLYFRWLLWLGPAALSEYLPLGESSGISSERIFPDLRKRHPKWTTPRTVNGLLDLFNVSQELLIKRLSSDKRKGGPDRRVEMLINPNPIEDAETLVKAFMNFQLIQMKYEPGQDEDESVIFRNLNGQGTPLASIDHVKNRLFLSIGAEGDRIHRDYWEPAELQLDKISYARKRDDAATLFLYDFLISRGVRDASKNRLAWQLETYQSLLAGAPGVNPNQKQIFIERHLVPAMWDWMVVVESGDKIRDPKAPHRLLPQLARDRIKSIQYSSIATIPFLLRLLTTWRNDQVSDEDFIQYLILLDGYLMRALIAGKSLSPMRAEIMGLLAGFPAYPSFVTVEEFRTQIRDIVQRQELDLSDAAMKRQLEEAQLYLSLSAGQCFNLLVGIETHSQPNPADFTAAKGKLGYTVEHIAPQTLKKWQSNLRAWEVSEDVMSSYIHRLGNLSLATRQFNSEQGNKPLAVKQGKLGQERALHLNQTWSTQAVWRPDEISSRARDLAQRFILRWPRP